MTHSTRTMIRWLACLGLGGALAGCGCATPTASTDAAMDASDAGRACLGDGACDADTSDGGPVAPDSGPFCAALLPQLMAGGWDQCPTYCPTGIRCDAPFRCDLPPYGCYGRWAYCYAGQVVVSTSGIVCDAGSASVDASYDAGPDAFYDAGPYAVYFVLEPAPFDVVLERCAELEGATAVARVTTHMTSSCDTPAPTQLLPDAATHTITVIADVWREQGRSDCVSMDATFTRDVPISSLSAGTWTFTGGSAPVTLVVASPPALTCPPPGSESIPAGGACAIDCECVTHACIATRGGATCGRMCALVCAPVGVGTEVPLAYGAASTCTDDPSLGWIVTPRTTNECDDTTPCPDGMACSPATDVPRVCAWVVTLPPFFRIWGPPCSTQSDCADPFDCVDDQHGHRTCEVRCLTEDMLCPSAYQCVNGTCQNWID